MKAQRPTRKRMGSIFTSSILLLTFFFVESVFIPNAFSAPAVSSADTVPNFESHAKFITTRDDERNETIFLDFGTNEFAVFSGTDFDLPVRLGKIEWDENGYRLESTREIQSTDVHYVLTDPHEGRFLAVNEKLPSGGFGRLLRYRGFNDEGEWLDLEFFYEDQEGRVTILDYGEGKFFSTQFKETRPVPTALFPRLNPSDNLAELTAAPSPSLKFLSACGRPNIFITPKVSRLHDRVEFLNDQLSWLNHLVRGPPGEGLAL